MEENREEIKILLALLKRISEFSSDSEKRDMASYYYTKISLVDYSDSDDIMNKVLTFENKEIVKFLISIAYELDNKICNSLSIKEYFTYVSIVRQVYDLF